MIITFKFLMLIIIFFATLSHGFEKSTEEIPFDLNACFNKIDQLKKESSSLSDKTRLDKLKQSLYLPQGKTLSEKLLDQKKMILPMIQPLISKLNTFGVKYEFRVKSDSPSKDIKVDSNCQAGLFYEAGEDPLDKSGPPKN